MKSAKSNGIESWDGTQHTQGRISKALWAQLRRQWEDTEVLGQKGCTAIACVMGIEGRVDTDWVFRYGMGVTQVKGEAKGGGEGYSRTVYDELRVRGSLGYIA